MEIPNDVAHEMLQLCQSIPKHHSKILKRLAPKEAALHTSVSTKGHKSVFLKQGVPSQRVLPGRLLEDRLIELVKGCGISFDHLQLNGPDLVCEKHRDGKNSSSLSHIIFLGGEGGALCLEGGTRFEERNKWFSFDGKNLTHWNEPSKGKYSLVAYCSNQAQHAPQQRR